jgi:hypothetical protein
LLSAHEAPPDSLDRHLLVVAAVDALHSTASIGAVSGSRRRGRATGRCRFREGGSDPRRSCTPRDEPRLIYEYESCIPLVRVLLSQRLTHRRCMGVPSGSGADVMGAIPRQRRDTALARRVRLRWISVPVTGTTPGALGCRL